MSALRTLAREMNPHVSTGSDHASVPKLYRTMLKELPRVLTLFDIDMELQPARAAVRYQFTKHGKIKDPKVVELMVAKGYMELEETLMMWKQKTHLMSLFEPVEKNPYIASQQNYFK